jgi:REP element-mobilizing transposase RayT
VTFRLVGTLPRQIVENWQRERQWLLHLAETNPTYHEQVAEQFERRWFVKFEEVLDGATVGPTWLRDDRIAAIIDESLRFRDNLVYRLDAYSIMPNHVHLLMKPLPVSDNDEDYHSLSSIMQSLKGYTAFKCNRLLGRTGEFWEHESFDRYIRDADEYQRTIAYVVNNPVKAGYVPNWRDWKWSYHRFN